jgi:YHS domain-containing protein
VKRSRIDWRSPEYAAHVQVHKDPVCWMMVEEDCAAATSVYQGRMYCFCNVACNGRFEANPASYVGSF